MSIGLCWEDTSKLGWGAESGWGLLLEEDSSGKGSLDELTFEQRPAVNEEASQATV